MTDEFKEKNGDKRVRYLGICTFYDIVTTNFNDNIHDIVRCLRCETLDTHEIFAIPILTFLNFFEPVDKPESRPETVMDEYVEPIEEINEGN